MVSEHETLIKKTHYPNFVVARNSFRMSKVFICREVLYLLFLDKQKR